MTVITTCLHLERISSFLRGGLLQDRLRTSDEKLRASMGKELRMSEERVKILHNKIRQLIRISRS